MSQTEISILTTIRVGYKTVFSAGFATFFTRNPTLFSALFRHVYAIVDITLTTPSFIEGPFVRLIGAQFIYNIRSTRPQLILINCVLLGLAARRMSMFYRVSYIRLSAFLFMIVLTQIVETPVDVQ